MIEVTTPSDPPSTHRAAALVVTVVAVALTAAFAVASAMLVTWLGG